MITVRCPACDAAYQLDEAKLAGAGRKLKCARCQVVWVARAPRASEADTPEAPVAAVDAPPASPDTHEAAPAADGVPEVAPESAPETAPADATWPPVPDETEEPAYHEPSVADLGDELGGRRGRWRTWLRGANLWRSGAVGLIALGVVTGGGLLALKLMPAGHEDGTAVTEVAAPGAPGHEVQPPEGIVLHNVRDEVSEAEGDTPGGMMLTVRGLLANTTSQTLVVPPMRLELLGSDGQLADMWPVGGVSGPMEGGAERAWTVSLSAPDMRQIKGWRVLFVADAPAAQLAE